MAPYSTNIPYALTSVGTPLLGVGSRDPTVSIFQNQPNPEAEIRPRLYKCTFCVEVFESRYALSSHYGKHKDLSQSEWVKYGPSGSKIRKDILKAREEGKPYVFKKGPWTRTRQASQAEPQARKRVPSPKPMPTTRQTNFPLHPLGGLLADTVNVVDAPPGFPVRDTSRVIPFRRLRGFLFYCVAKPIFEAMIPIQGPNGVCTCSSAQNPNFQNVGQVGSVERPREHVLHKGNEVGSSSNVMNPVIKEEVGAPVGEEMKGLNVKVKKEY